MTKGWRISINLGEEWLPKDFFGRKKLMSYVDMLSSAHSDGLADIHERSFSHPWSVADFERLLSDRYIIADGLFIGNNAKLCGFILSRCVVDEGEVLTVALDPSVRSQGLSRKLLQEHLSVLERKGARRVFLEVDEKNIAALALYKGLGFKEIGRREGYYRHTHEESSAALTMKVDF